MGALFRKLAHMLMIMVFGFLSVDLVMFCLHALAIHVSLLLPSVVCGSHLLQVEVCLAACWGKFGVMLRFEAGL